MNKEALNAFARGAAKGIQTEQNLNKFRQVLTRVTVGRVLNAELGNHLGCDKHEPSVNSNSCNGTSSNILHTEDGQFQLDTPMGREGSFESKLVKKSHTRFASMEDAMLFLYA